MNIYDFDGTIYDGDSSIDFFKYTMKKHKKVISLLPGILVAYALYLVKLKEKAAFKNKFFSIVKCFTNLEEDVKDFWKINDKKIKKFYKENKKEDDIIISASPEFLLKPICDDMRS